MSWLARSLVGSLSSNHGHGDDEERIKEKAQSPSKEEESNEDCPMEPETPTRGVKEDLSELTETLTRQFWGVASFLAPLPASQNPNSRSAPETDSSASDRGRRSVSSDPVASRYADEAAAAESPRISGIRSDFAEIGGKFRSGISMLSNTMAVSEISKIASTFLPFGGEEEEVDREEGEEENFEVRAVGVTEEVLAFARNISMHPETWLDFPLFHEDEDSDKARAMLLQDLQNRTEPGSERSGRETQCTKEDVTAVPIEHNVVAPSKIIYGTVPSKTPSFGEPISDPLADVETEKHPVQATEVKIIDKSVIEEQPPLQSKIKDLPSETSKFSIAKDEEDGDEWPEEDIGELGSTGGAAVPLEEDVSFSDLEDDDDRGTLSGSKSLDANDSQTKDWVRLNKGSGGSSKSGDSTSPQSKESNDWLNVEHIDVE